MQSIMSKAKVGDRTGCEYQSADWFDLVAAGWWTVAIVGSAALMQKGARK